MTCEGSARSLVAETCPVRGSTLRRRVDRNVTPTLFILTKGRGHSDPIRERGRGTRVFPVKRKFLPCLLPLEMMEREWDSNV